MTAPVVRVTEVAGTIVVEGSGESYVEVDAFTAHGIADLAPNGIVGKRGRLKITCEFVEE